MPSKKQYSAQIAGCERVKSSLAEEGGNGKVKLYVNDDLHGE